MLSLQWGHSFFEARRQSRVGLVDGKLARLLVEYDVSRKNEIEKYAESGSDKGGKNEIDAEVLSDKNRREINDENPRAAEIEKQPFTQRRGGGGTKNERSVRKPAMRGTYCLR